MNKFKIFAAVSLFSAIASITGSANATLIGVNEIRVTNGYTGADAYIQLSEIIARQTGTGTNVALNGTTTSNGSYDGNSTPNKAVDGLFSNLSFPNMYHSSGTTGAFFDVVFSGGPVSLDSVTLYGRSDCCSYRDIYNLQFFSVDHRLLLTINGINANNGTHSATVAVPEPTTLALLGLGLLGFAASRRKSAK